MSRRIRKIETRLAAWAIANASRDQLVREAHDAGISTHRIHVLTGIARTTIARILKDASAPSTARAREDGDDE